MKDIRVQIDIQDDTVEATVVPGPAVTVGRSRACDIRVDDRTVSGKHMELRVHLGTLQVRDANSRHGVSVAEQRIPAGAWVSVGADEEVWFGDATLTLSGTPTRAADKAALESTADSVVDDAYDASTVGITRQIGRVARWRVIVRSADSEAAFSIAGHLPDRIGEPQLPSGQWRELEPSLPLTVAAHGDTARLTTADGHAVVAGEEISVRGTTIRLVEAELHELASVIAPAPLRSPADAGHAAKAAPGAAVPDARMAAAAPQPAASETSGHLPEKSGHPPDTNRRNDTMTRVMLPIGILGLLSALVFAAWVLGVF